VPVVVVVLVDVVPHPQTTSSAEAARQENNVVFIMDRFPFREEASAGAWPMSSTSMVIVFRFCSGENKFDF
jgi:hypothetical protein